MTLRDPFEQLRGMAAPLEHLLRMAENLRSARFEGPGSVAEMQDCARRIRQACCDHPRVETANGVERCPDCGLLRSIDFGRPPLAPAAPAPCQIAQQSDEMFCASCGLRWDVNDPEPPSCRRAAR